MTFHKTLFFTVLLLTATACVPSSDQDGSPNSQNENPEIREQTSDVENSEQSASQETNTPAESEITFGNDIIDAIDDIHGGEANQAEDATTTSYTVDMANYTFTPNRIEIKAGATIEITLIGQEGLHDFVLDEWNVQSSRLSAGEEQVITLTAPADSAGEQYEFYCSVGSHRALGMVGTLVVVE